MTIARHAAVNGDWLLVAEPLDKPPLTYYANALSLMLFAVDSDTNGVLFLDVHKGEFVGRLPALWMSVLLVAVMMRLTRYVKSDGRIVLWSGLLVALSPLRIVFAPTAFTDMPMLLFAALALWGALAMRPFFTGFWWMVSLIAKPQSLFYLPLLLLLLILRGRLRNLRDWLAFLLPLVAGIWLVAAWDGVRVEAGAESFYALGQARYTTTAITSFDAYPARLQTLWQTLQHTFGIGVLTALLTIFVGSAFVRGNAMLRTFALWLMAFVGVHIILTLNLFDRNLILLLPPAALLVASGIISLNIRLQIVLMGLLLVFALFAASGTYDIGGDDGRHLGIDELAAHLDSKPIASVIYDPWLDWQLDYYMGQWTDKRRVFYPAPEFLVRDALALDETATRYFVVPRSIAVASWLSALRRAGFGIALDFESVNFRVYALSPPV